MNGRRVVIGLSLLCALAFSAFSAPSASAVKGTTAFTCVEKAKSEFRGEHCLKDGVGEFEHEAIEVGKTTEVEGTNAKTAQTTASAHEPLLTSTVFGNQVEISCETQSSTGHLKNETTENAEKEKYMRVKGDKSPSPSVKAGRKVTPLSPVEKSPPCRQGRTDLLSGARRAERSRWDAQPS